VWGNGIKLSAVAKFVIQGCDLQELGEFLCTGSSKICPHIHDIIIIRSVVPLGT
jgi:hypothetical protein